VDDKKEKIKGSSDLEKPVAQPFGQEDNAEFEGGIGGSRGVLDQLEEPGGLEVADMPESNELQERRRKTKNRLKELASMKEPGEERGEEEPFEEESGLLDMLKEAKLSTRHLKFCCGGVVALFLLIGLFFGGRALFTAWQNRPEEPDATEPEEPTDNEDDDEFNFLDPSVLSGILVGEDMPEADDALQTGQDLGAPEETTGDSLTQSMVDFASIYEAMQVNVNELLTQSNQRRETLEDYQNQLQYLLYLGKQNIEKLEEESSALISQFEAREEEKADAETRYFSNLRELDSYAAVAALNTFTEHGEEIVRLRAQYNARQKLLTYYEDVLASMELRVRDIELNEEALLKGVQVVDIEGSDLDLIIDENEL